MKKILLLLLMSIVLSESKAQSICDSTYMVCDSIFIDSAFIISTASSEWLAFNVSVNHDFLYAPNFVVCPSLDSIMFVDESKEFTSIFGPSTHFIHYVFQNFNFPLDFELSGNVVVDNSNNNDKNCQIPFSVIINESTGINAPSLEKNIEIFPNPVNELLVIKVLNGSDAILNIQLFNLAGIKQSVNSTDNGFDLTAIAPGLYTIHIELNSGKRIIKKIIKV